MLRVLGKPTIINTITNMSSCDKTLFESAFKTLKPFITLFIYNAFSILILLVYL